MPTYLTKHVASTECPEELQFSRAFAIDAYWVHISTRTETQLKALEDKLHETKDERLVLAYALTEAVKHNGDYHFMFEVDEYEE